MELQSHELANLFPMMSGPEFESLVRDIQENGLTCPTILLHSDGRILDGRNRYAACRRLGIDIKTETFAGDDKAALAHVVSVNLERRQLTTSQRAAIAAEIATLKHGEHLKTMPRDERGVPQKPKEAILPLRDSAPQSGMNTRAVGKSRQEAADMVKVSKGTVKSATIVKRKAPHIHEMVRSGEVNVNTARLFVTLGDEQAIEAAKTGEDVRAGANKARQQTEERSEARVVLESNDRNLLAKIIRATKELSGIASDLSSHAYIPSHKFSQIKIREIADRLSACCETLVELTSKE